MYVSMRGLGAKYLRGRYSIVGRCMGADRTPCYRAVVLMVSAAIRELSTAGGATAYELISRVRRGRVLRVQVSGWRDGSSTSWFALSA